MSIVSVVSSTYENVYDRLKGAISLSGGLDINGQDKILVKINFCDVRTADTGAVTHPVFLDALLRIIREQHPDMPLYVIESDGTVVLADAFLRWLGYTQVLEKWDVPFVNLSKDKNTPKQINGLFFKELPIPQIFNNAYYITLAKLKTNNLSQITCALKNQYGCMPEVIKSTYHTVLDKAIADVNLAYPPNFSIVDGIVAQGGVQGPAFGTPVMANTIVAGADPVAVDTVCAKIMGIPTFMVGHLHTCQQVGVGSMKYELVGDPLPDVKFDANLFGMMVFKLGTNIKKISDNKRRKTSVFHEAMDHGHA
jgi:uncharacterized protein (DUF362 family)